MGNIFQFSSSASLEKLTGLQAFTLEELLELIRTCPDSAIFYHTFSALLKMREAQTPYNSDFAAWVAQSLNEKALAEKLMAVDLPEHNTIGSLRHRLVQIIEEYREEIPQAFQKRADEPFYLHDILRVVYLTDKFAYDLASFRDQLETISIYSLYFHFIESRLSSGLQTNDFSIWLEESLNLSELARRVTEIDIHAYNLEELRRRIIQRIEEQMSRKDRGADAS
jgi:hypothetical protein